MKQAPFNKRIHSKIFSRKIWWNETKGFIFAPRNLQETAGRKKEKMLE